MGLFARISRIFRSNLNDLLDKAEDPGKILEQTVIDMQEDLIQLRKAVVGAIASQKLVEQKYNQNQSQGNSWQQRAQLALQKGDEALAREALVRKKTYVDAANTLKSQLDQQSGNVDMLRRSLIALEGKISEAKTRKDMLKSRSDAAKAQEQIQNAMSNIGTSGAIATFERMEEKVFIKEAQVMAAADLAGAGLEQRFVLMESGSDVDDELAEMRLQLSGGGAAAQASLMPASPAIDAELEDLKRQLDGLS